MTQILGQWIDRENRLSSASAVPIRLQFLAVGRRPLLDIAEGRAIKIAGDDATVEVHGSARSGVMGMEVRRCVAAFIPIHVDRYSSEVADPRHAPMLALGHLCLAGGRRVSVAAWGSVALRYKSPIRIQVISDPRA